MINITFPPNPVLLSMQYGDETLILKFKKQTRKYLSVPIEIAYKLVYSKTPVKCFNEYIKKKYNVVCL